VDANRHEHMQVALNLAKLGEGRTRPNPPVGAVIVREGRVVGQGFHPRAGEPHAEIFALREARESARGAELYVTLEPCCHTGRTGPCTEAIIAAGIRKVYVGAVDPNPRVAGNGIAQLREAGIDVEQGLMESECRYLVAPFARHVTTGMPLVLFKGAMTLDGVTATRSGDSRWISSAESRDQVHRLRDRVDALMVGAGTVLADNPRLTTRLQEGGRDADRIIVDTRLRIPEDASVLESHSGARVIVATTKAADPQKRQRLEGRGVEILETSPGADSRIDPRALCRVLGQQGYQYIMLEGGAQLAGSFWRCGLIQRVQLYIAPKICGGSDGRPLFVGAGVERMADACGLQNVRMSLCGGDMVVEAEVPECSPD